MNGGVVLDENTFVYGGGGGVSLDHAMRDPSATQNRLVANKWHS